MWPKSGTHDPREWHLGMFWLLHCYLLLLHCWAAAVVILSSLCSLSIFSECSLTVSKPVLQSPPHSVAAAYLPAGNGGREEHGGRNPCASFPVYATIWHTSPTCAASSHTASQPIPQVPFPNHKTILAHTPWSVLPPPMRHLCIYIPKLPSQPTPRPCIASLLDMVHLTHPCNLHAFFLTCAKPEHPTWSTRHLLHTPMIPHTPLNKQQLSVISEKFWDIHKYKNILSKLENLQNYPSQSPQFNKFQLENKNETHIWLQAVQAHTAGLKFEHVHFI